SVSKAETSPALAAATNADSSSFTTFEGRGVAGNGRGVSGFILGVPIPHSCTKRLKQHEKAPISSPDQIGCRCSTNDSWELDAFATGPFTHSRHVSRLASRSFCGACTIT